MICASVIYDKASYLIVKPEKLFQYRLPTCQEVSDLPYVLAKNSYHV